jgi:PHP family Zn ribbon phosphoesterase
VDGLADRVEKDIPIDKFIPHKYIVPLRELIGKVFGVGKKSKKVEKEYSNLIKNLGNEFHILLHSTVKEIGNIASDKNIAVAIANMRAGAVKISPGYDGVYGVVEPVLIKGKNKIKQSRLLL